MAKKKIAVIGIGKIAQDQHLPVIDKSPDFELAACVSTRGLGHRDVPVFKTPAELYKAMPDVGLVAICTPPGVRHAMSARRSMPARTCCSKSRRPRPSPSSKTSSPMAKRRAACSSRPGTRRYNAAVDAAKLILKDEGVASVRIDWRESVRKWHPGQDWVWEPGGFGVCDPGINAMSIFTKIMPFPVFVESAKLKFPANRQTPVDVEIVFKSGRKEPAQAQRRLQLARGVRARSGPSPSRPRRAPS